MPTSKWTRKEHDARALLLEMFYDSYDHTYNEYGTPSFSKMICAETLERVTSNRTYGDEHIRRFGGERMTLPPEVTDATDQ